MLIERLGSQLQELGLPPDRQIEIICATLHDAWLPLLDGPPFVTATEKAVELARIIESNWSALDKPCSERTIISRYHTRKSDDWHSIPRNPYSSTATPINGICSGLQAAQMGQIH